MKTKITKVFLFLLLIGSASNAVAGYGVKYVTMSPAPYYTEKEHNEYEEKGHRTPPRDVQCTIDAAAGIQFVGMEKLEILTFEIYDLSGACVAVFGDEDSFLDFLFAQSGEYQIRLVTANWAYVGYIGV